MSRKNNKYPKSRNIQNKTYSMNQIKTTPLAMPYWQYGPERGTFDPVGNFGAYDLIGTPSNPGYLVQMRIGHPLITSIMDSRKALIESTKFTFTGRGSEKLNQFFEYNVMYKNSYNNQSAIISYIIDSCASYGFSLMEQLWDGDGEVELIEVDPRTVDEFVVDPNNRDCIVAIKFLDGITYKEVPISKFLYITRDMIAGNFWGVSELRSLVQNFILLQADYGSYIQKSALSSGIIYAKQVADGNGLGSGPAAESLVQTNEFLNRFLQGQSVSTILDPNIELALLNAPNTGIMADFLSARTSFDDQVRQVLNSNLNTLGLSSVGSKALGEEIKASDEERFEAYLESWLTRIVNSDFMKYICDCLGVDRSEIGLTTTNRASTEVKIDMDKLFMLIDKGIVSVEELGDKNKQALLKAVGLDIDAMGLADPEASEGEIVIPTPPEAILNSAVALEELAGLPVSDRPVIPDQMTRRARKIASNVPLSELDKSRLRAFFSKADANTSPLIFNLNGGEAMRSFLYSENIQDSSLSESVMSENSRYKDIDFTPPKGVKEAAKRALEVRAEKPASQRGMTDVGIARARDLSNGKNLSPETVRRMLAYFERHEVDKKGESWDEQGKGWQAWHGWGGDAGFSWAKKIVGQMDNIDDKE